MRLTKTKWPKWLVPNWVSKPSEVWPFGQAMTPALAMTRSNGSPAGNQGVGAGADAGQRRQIEFHQLQPATVGRLGANLLGRRLRLIQIPCRADDLGAVGGQGAGGLHTKPCRYAGHQNALAAQVHAFKHFVRRGRGSKFSSHSFLRCWGSLQTAQAPFVPSAL